MDKHIFAFWQKHNGFPCNFPMDYEDWQESWERDIDSDGRLLFSSLRTELSFDGTGAITGLIRYGKTAFGFDDSGECSEDVHYNVIRDLCFEDADSAARLLRSALAHFPAGERIYAFFHYFGMSTCGRHGKLHERNLQIQTLLLENGFTVEHENVYYTKDLSAFKPQNSPVVLRWGARSAGDCREFAAAIHGDEVCWGQLHFLPQGDIAYLRWIYVDEQRQHTGIGSQVMHALFSALPEMGICRLDTDTALDNRTARHFYEKNGFVNCGITRSFYTK